MKSTSRPGGSASGDTRVPRRDALLRLAGLAVGAALPGRPSVAQDRVEGTRLDLHHHFFPPVAKKRYGPFPPLQNYAVAGSLQAMDGAGIRKAFLSLPTRLGDDAVAIREEAVGFSREANEFAARAVSDHPGRFGFFAFLPLPDVDASLRRSSTRSTRSARTASA